MLPRQGSRLGESGWHGLETGAWLPAPAQGAIGIECRADDDSIRALIGAIDDAPSRTQVSAERALLAALGGSCHSPIAVLTTHDGNDLTMRAALFSVDGAERIERSMRFAADDRDAPADLRQNS